MATIPADSQFLTIESASNEGAFGVNRLPEPTDAQKKLGNYKMGRFMLYGLPIVIEQPRNSYRTGVSATGKRWVSRMAAHYGYVGGTKGADGDAVDVFVGYYPQSEMIYVVNQYWDGRFDEHKVMLAFPDEEAARNAYLGSYDKGWQGLKSLIPCSISQFKWWLKNSDLSRPLSADQLPFEGLEDMNRKLQWDDNAAPLGVTLDRVLYDVRRNDAGGLLLDSVTVAEIMDDADSVMTLDALVVPFQRLERQMNIIRSVMERAGQTVKPSALQITEPFKQRGTANVAAVFELSDGQTVSVFFHNPDVTPTRIAPTDELVSWKWMLNKKDITIVVAPERGSDLNVREVARRIMKLAEKNSAAFARANARRADRMQSIEGLKTEIAQLETELTQAQRELEVAKIAAESRPVPTPDPAPAPDPVEPTIPVKQESEESAQAEASDGLLDYAQKTRRALVVLGFEASGAGNMLIRRDGDIAASVKTEYEEPSIISFMVTVLKSGEQQHDAIVRVDISSQDLEGPTATADKINAEATLPAATVDPTVEANGGADIAGVNEGDRIRWTPGADASERGQMVVEGILARKEDTSAGDFRLTIRTDIDAPQGGGKIERIVRASDGSIEVLPGGLNEAEASSVVDPTPEPAPVSGGGADDEAADAGKIAAVDAAYSFASATDKFKLWLHGSLTSEVASPFVTAKAMDEAAKRNGATIEWGEFEGAALDDVGHAISQLQVSLGVVNNNAPINEAEGEAEQAALERDIASSIEEAIEVLEESTRPAAGEVKQQGVKVVVVDATETSVSGELTLDAVDQPRIVGRIHKDGAVVGRIDIAINGKAMVFVGPEGDDRVQYNGRATYYSDDDAPLMIDWLFEGLAPAKNTEQIEAFEHAGFRIYPMNLRGADGGVSARWAVQSIDNKQRAEAGEREAGGDTILETRDAAIAEAERQVSVMEQDAARAAELAEQERAAAAEREAYLAKHADFIESQGYSPAMAERARKALGKKYSSDGTVTTLADLIKSRVESGYTISSDDGVRFLEKDGSGLGEKKITKIGMDYAAFLISKRAVTPAENHESQTPDAGDGIDYKGFTRKDESDGFFTLTQGNMTVRVEPTEDGKYQAHFGGARSTPHLPGVQGAVDWAAAYRDESLRVEGESASAPALTEARAFMQSLIDGQADFMDADIPNRLEQIKTEHGDDTELSDLWDKATRAYISGMTKAATAQLAGE